MLSSILRQTYSLNWEWPWRIYCHIFKPVGNWQSIGMQLINKMMKQERLLGAWRESAKESKWEVTMKAAKVKEKRISLNWKDWRRKWFHGTWKLITLLKSNMIRLMKSMAHCKINKYLEMSSRQQTSKRHWPLRKRVNSIPSIKTRLENKHAKLALMMPIKHRQIWISMINWASKWKWQVLNKSKKIDLLLLRVRE